MCLAVGRFDRIEHRCFARAQLDLQGVNDPPGDLVLDREDVAQFAIEAVGPKMSAGFRVDQLRGDPYPIAGAADAPFEHGADAEFTGHHAYVDRLALIGEARIARDHQQAADLREVGDHILGYPVGEIFLLRVAAHVLERQHGDRRLVGDTTARPARRFPPASRASPGRATPIAANKPASARRCS